MASNLPKHGDHLIVHDADQTKATRAATSWSNTIASSGQPAAFSNCQVIITMLPHGKIVRDVLLGPYGIAPALALGTIVVDTSSSSPFDTQSLGADLATRHGVQLIDCSTTQTYMHTTAAGQSTAMVGCDSAAAFARVKPVLECMFSYIFHMGPLGTGHAMKTLNNYIMASSSINALCYSLVAGQKFGLDPQQMIDVLNVGTGVCFPMLDTFRRDGITGRYNSGFGLALLAKDLGITTEFMEHNGFKTELPGLSRRNLQYSLNQVEPDANHTKCLPGWEMRSGVKLRMT